MSYYRPNPACRCGRCATRGLMGPAVLVTLGLLFLADNMLHYPFARTWPVLLIVIGGIRVLYSLASEDGHFNPGQNLPYGGEMPPYASSTAATGAPASQPIVTPPPARPAGELGGGSESGEVHRG